MTLTRTSLIAALAITLAGCGSSDDFGIEVEPVSGVVQYNGTPVPNAVITFKAASSGFSTTAVTDSDGQFKVKSFGKGNGLAHGSYTVAIGQYPITMTSYDATGDEQSPEYTGQDNGVTEAPKPVRGRAPQPTETGSMLPKQYETAQTSPLTLQVDKEASLTNVVFDLTD